MRAIHTFLFLLFSSTLFSQTIMLSAERLFDGMEMHSNYAVLVNGNRITEVGPTKNLQGKADSIINLGNSTLMPGMIEGHSHVLLYPYDQTDWNDQVLKESRSLRAIRGAKMAEKNLMAGFTTIRDLGSEGAAYADVAIKQSIELGINPGPRMLVAGRAIVASGSYGPSGYNPDMDVILGAQPADGADLIRVTREQIGYGADVIKVYADYRWGPNKTAMPTFSVDELKTIVETAKSSGRDVVAHASTAEGMRRAILAGVRSIEHGSDATDEVLELMKEHDVALCPTLAATYAITTYRGWDDKTQPEPEAILKSREFFKKVLKSDVKVVAGGDVGVFAHGENARELVLMSEYGMENNDVLKAATSGNAEVFRLSDLGQLKEGFLADIIAVNGNPLTEIKDLFNVGFVMKDGVVYKSENK
ncbi:metal-dependent hydrolase family protein [Flavimarina sp. Hel_I_48]|uniref:metal-dependent hydrolase family protein n=1 Tax=Flavimarina sp. Hel_I_48 TaxID=1392488 RepID=UPI0004DED287|nr:amidohydrolase family protein [Flavimarina sp. Hel_I_48]